MLCVFNGKGAGKTVVNKKTENLKLRIFFFKFIKNVGAVLSSTQEQQGVVTLILVDVRADGSVKARFLFSRNFKLDGTRILFLRKLQAGAAQTIF